MGYVDFSESENSARAKRDGNYPATLLARRIRRFFPGVTSNAIKNVMESTEWHHTSSRYNCTDFYDLRDLAECELRHNLRAAIAALKKQDVLKTSEKGVMWIEWSGSRNYPTKTTYWVEKAVLKKSNCMTTIQGCGELLTVDNNNKYWATKTKNTDTCFRKKEYQVNVVRPIFVR